MKMNSGDTTQTIILVKDGKEYTGEAVMKAGRPGQEELSDKTLIKQTKKVDIK